MIWWAGAVALALAVASPLILGGRGQGGQISWIPDPTLATVRKLPADLFVGTAAAGFLLTLGLVALVTLAANPNPNPSPNPGRGRSRSRDRGQQWLAVFLATWALLPPLLAYVTAEQLHFFRGRYLLFTVPAWVLLTAYGIVQLTRNGRSNEERAAGKSSGERRPRQRKRVVAATLTAVVAVTALGWPQQRKLRTDAVNDEYGIPAAAALIAADGRPGDGIVFTGYYYLHRGFRYEWRGVPAAEQPREVLVEQPAGREWSWRHPPCPARETVACLAGTRRLWLVSSDPDRGAGPLAELPPWQSAVADRYRVVRTVAFHRLWVSELALR